MQYIPKWNFNFLHLWIAGTCSNNLEDDFEGKDGTVIDSVPDFGASWRVSGTDEECECYPRGSRRCSNCSVWEYSCNSSNTVKVKKFWVSIKKKFSDMIFRKEFQTHADAYSADGLELRLLDALRQVYKKAFAHLRRATKSLECRTGFTNRSICIINKG